MPSSSPASKRAKLSAGDISKSPMHNLYQVVYNINVDKSEISRYVFHCFVTENGWLKVRLYALVDIEGEAGKEKSEAIALWKGYVQLSQIEKSSSTDAFASSISAGEMHISGDQSKIRRKESGKLTLHLNHNSSSPIIVELSSSNDTTPSSLMDICCASITKLHSKAPPEQIVILGGNSKTSSHGNHEVEALRKENERLQHDLRDARRQYSAVKGGYDNIDPKIVNQVPKGTSKLQPSVKQAKKAERGFADDDEW